MVLSVQCVVFLDRVSDSMDSGTTVDTIYLDFAKAFDKVPHGRLLSKLEKYGISGQLLQWIKAWLCGRSQRVCLEGTVSDWVAVTSSVPQGSVLALLQFLIYINDLEDGIKSFLLKFAYDTKIFREIRTTEDTQQLQEDLDTVYTRVYAIPRISRPPITTAKNLEKNSDPRISG